MSKFPWRGMPWVAPYATSFPTPSCMKAAFTLSPLLPHTRNARTQSPEPSASLTSSLVMEDATLHGASLGIPSVGVAMGGAKGTVQFTHILQKDCFLVFRSLCKLSMKGISNMSDPRLALQTTVTVERISVGTAAMLSCFCL